MTKNKTILVIIALVAITTTDAFSQVQGRFRGSLDAGWTVGSLYTGWTLDDIMVEIHLGYNIQHNMNVGIRGQLANLRQENNNFESRGYSRNFMGTYTYFFGSGTIMPFIGGGAGIYWIDINVRAWPWSSERIINNNKIGGFLTTGIEFGRFRMALQYNLLPASNVTFQRVNWSELEIETRNVTVKHNYLAFTVGFYLGGGNRRVEREKRAERLMRELEEAERARFEREERERTANLFSTFAHKFVEANINQWQQRGEFEILADWQARVNDSTRQAKILELLQEAEQIFIEERSQNFSIGNIIGVYNVEYEHFPLLTDIHGNLFLPVPANEAQSFRDKWENHLRMPRFAISNDRLALIGMTFIATDGTTSNYNFSAPVEITISESDIAVLQSRRISTANVAALPAQNDTREEVAEKQNRTVQRSFQQGDFAVGGHLAILPESGLPTFGIGTRLRYNITNPIRLEGAFTYFLRTARVGDTRQTESLWDISMNMHYLFAVAENVTLYPLLGFSVIGGAVRGERVRVPLETDFLFNLGGGIDIKFNNRTSVNLEPKFWLNIENRVITYVFMLSAGIVYRF